MPEGSRAPYIIICNGRIDLRTARDPLGRIAAASRCATDLVKYYGERLTYEDTAAISNLQHAMMELIEGKTLARTRQQPNHPDEMVDEMFVLLDALEQKFS